MATVTLLQLRTRARTRADMPLASFVSDAEVNSFINEGGQMVHEKLVSAYAEIYAFSSLVTVTPLSGVLALPADFFKLYGIDMTVAGRARTMKPLMTGERNLWKSRVWSPACGSRYWLQAQNVTFLPTPPVNTAIEISYAPEFTQLVADSDSVAFPNGWERYIVAYAAMQMLMKEESDVSDIRAVLGKMEAELEQVKENRDAAFPKQTIDAEALDHENYNGWGY